MTSMRCCSRHATPCPGPAWKPRWRPSWPKAGPGGTASGWFSCRRQGSPPAGVWPWAPPAVVAPGSPAPAPGTIRTAAFTLARNANGTASLTLNQDQMFDPAALQQALARDGIPALVQTGTYCTSTPASLGISGVLSVQLPDGSPLPTPGHRSRVPVPPDAVTVINPAAMPAGTELSFTYVNHDHDLIGRLIYTAAHTCSSS